MSNGTIRPRSSDFGLGLVAGGATESMQDLGPIQNIIQLHPDHLRPMMEMMSPFVVGATVTVALILFAHKPANEVKKLIVVAFLSLLLALAAMIVTTLSFAEDIRLPNMQPYRAIVGITAPVVNCDSKPCDSYIECLTHWGMGRDGSMICWGRSQVIFAEVLLFTTFIAVELALGALGTLLRIFDVSGE